MRTQEFYTMGGVKSACGLAGCHGHCFEWPCFRRVFMPTPSRGHGTQHEEFAGGLAEQRLHGDLGPAFELVESREDVGHGLKRASRMSASRGRTFGSLDVAEVDHAEVDLADGGFVVVDQADDGFVVRRVDDHFFVELAAHSFAVDVVRGADFGVDRGDVAADADAVLRVQSGFALPPPRWYSNRWRRAAASVQRKRTVGNELLEAGVFFHFAAGPVFDVVAFNDARPVAVDFAREALEVAEPWKRLVGTTRIRSSATIDMAVAGVWGLGARG